MSVLPGDILTWLGDAVTILNQADNEIHGLGAGPNHPANVNSLNVQFGKIPVRCHDELMGWIVSHDLGLFMFESATSDEIQADYDSRG